MHLITDIWPILIIVVLMPLVWQLSRWLVSLSSKHDDDHRKENTRAHDGLRDLIDAVSERLRKAEITLAGMEGRLEGIKDVPTRHEFEQAMANVSGQLATVQQTLVAMTKFRTGTSGGYPAVRDPRRE